jgi:hypothetical protein
MEIREITTYHKDAPFTGYGIWVTFEMNNKKAHLLHPVHFTDLILTEYEYVRASGKVLWPVNNTGLPFNLDKWRKHFKERIKFFVDNGRGFPIQLVAKTLAEIEGKTLDEALKYIGVISKSDERKTIPIVFQKANIEYALVNGVDLTGIRGRPLTIVKAFQETGPASVYKVINQLNGRLKTKSDTNRVVTYFVHKLAAQGILEILA